MICIQLSGGLGNQMFQYACGRALAYKHQTELILDTSQLKMKRLVSGITFRSFKLSIFNLNAQEANNNDLKKLKPLFYRIANVLSLKTGLKGIQTSKYFIEKEYSFNANIENTGENCFLAGYWQSFKYFQSIEALIRKEFTFQQVVDKETNDRIAKITNYSSVSLHIRRTDFVNSKHHDIHGVCSIEYYKNAAEYIAKQTSSPIFFIFSDDIEWVRANLNLPYPCEFVSENVGKQSYIDMQLMSLCKHNIIANSSFSWWGAWLNLSPDKVVIAPKQWFVDETMNAKTNDLIPETWLRL